MGTALRAEPAVEEEEEAAEEEVVAALVALEGQPRSTEVVT